MEVLRFEVDGRDYLVEIDFSTPLYRALKRDAARVYGDRRRDVIYAHCLDYPGPRSCTGNGQVAMTGQMAAGELMHRGLTQVQGFYPAPRMCKRINLDSIEGISLEAVKRFVKKDDRGYYVILCGQADALTSTDRGLAVVELKTVGEIPSGKSLKDKLVKWVRRTAVYVWLYGVEWGLLIVTERGDLTRQAAFWVPRRLAEEVPWIVKRWLRG